MDIPKLKGITPHFTSFPQGERRFTPSPLAGALHKNSLVPGKSVTLSKAKGLGRDGGYLHGISPTPDFSLAEFILSNEGLPQNDIWNKTPWRGKVRMRGLEYLGRNFPGKAR